MSTVLYILVALLVFGVLIAVHELGHFLAAKACGVKVNEFSIGMGPAIFKKPKGETLYALRCLPFGGFCAMEGEDETSEDPRALENQGFWAKLLIFAAGAAMNFLTGLLIILCLYGGAKAFVTPVIADCLYTGLSTDTGCFLFGNTTAHTHKVAAALMEAGARVEELNPLLFENKSKGRIAIERTALENLEYYFDQQCALISMTREQIAASGVSVEDLEGVTGLPRKIEGVRVGVTLRQNPSGSYKVSIRTVKGVDACAIARRLGGGGHEQAAGCELEGNLENAKAAVLAEVEKELARSAKEQE